MKDYIKSAIKMVIAGAIAIIIGVLLMNNAGSFLKIIMIAAGIGALYDGIYTLVMLSKFKYTDTTKTLTTIKAVESCVIGLAAVLVAIFAAEEALTVMVWIFAAGLVFSAVVAFQNAVVAGKFGADEKRNRFIVEGVITLLIAIILFFKPVDTLVTIVKILAIAFIVIGALFIAGAVIAIIRKTKKTDDGAVETEAEVVEEKKD
ncbi:MAG: DUF308 domain-containing protein [Spirochaetales bacterium]|nr:DUF308 domain-containing protein [Spirochaetales bacterium]